MRYKLGIGVTIVVGTLTGCASTSPMPDEHYRAFTQLWGTLNKCHENGKVDATTMSRATSALSYTLKTWDYDGIKFSRMTQRWYDSADVSESSCRNTRLNAFQMINNADRHQKNRQASQQGLQQIAASLNSIGNDLNRTGQSYQRAAGEMNQAPQNDWSQPVQESPNIFEYEYEQNPANRLSILQTYVRRETSNVSGRQVCVYSEGATLVLPYGESLCPIYFNPRQ